MSSTVALSNAFAATSQAQLQMALAAKITKSNAEAQQSMVALIQAASENLQQVSKGALPAGVGEAIDVSG